MRHTLVRLTGVLIALMLVLTGCNLITIDPMMQLDEDFAALKKQYSGVVATYDGGQLTQEDVMGRFTSQYAYMSQLYSMYGLSMSSDMATDIEQSVVENAVQDIAVAQQIEARGLKLDDEKLAEIEAETDEHYQEAYDSLYASATGETDEVRARQTEYNLAVNGYTREAIYDMELASANDELIEQALRDEITEVTDEALQAAYDEKVSEDEDQYADSASSFESAMTSEDDIVAWMPEGYRTVKHILVKPEDDVLSAVTSARSAYSSAETSLEDLRSELDALNDDDAETAGDEAAEEEAADEAAEENTARTAEEIQADIDAAEASLDSLKADVEKAEADCLASVQDKLDEIYAKIDAGEDFADLIEAYGEDPGMQNEPTKTRGYYVSANSTTWDSYFTAGAMSLENVGDVTRTPAISSSGVHIIRYESDVTPGAVPLEDIRDALYDETLENLKTEHYNDELEAWVTALNPKYSIENFKLTAE